jgi:hypothetical protein
MNHKFTHKLTTFLGSKTFFNIVLGYLILSALWLVFSAVYPMAFDEDFHFGIIKIYATHWSPFLTSQPSGANAFGAVARDPSYLYHYLMSFPYRIIALFTSNQTTQVIILRLLNVAMFAGALVLFRRLLLRVRMSQAMTNVALAVYVLIPIVPFLAAHVNYDNLLLLLLPGIFLLLLTIVERLKKGTFDLPRFLLLTALCLLTSLVKYAFLPIFVAIFFYIIYLAIRELRAHGKHYVGDMIRTAWRDTPTKLSVGLIAFALLGMVLFVQRYGMNMVQYHNPIPSCDAVLDEEACMSYGPWGRNYVYAQNKPTFNRNLITSFTPQWIKGLWFRSFFVVNGPASGYDTRLPLPIPKWVMVVVALPAMACAIWFWRRVRKISPMQNVFLLASVIYLVALWLDDYSMYLYTGQAVAVNGRYLLPILLLLAAILGPAVSQALRKVSNVKPIVVGASLLVLLLEGGGIGTFIVRSDANWNWPSRVVIDANNTVRTIVKPLVIEGSKDR